MSFVPEKRRKMLEESFKELNIIDEDTDKIQVRSQLSDMSIVLDPKMTTMALSDQMVRHQLVVWSPTVSRTPTPMMSSW